MRGRGLKTWWALGLGLLLSGFFLWLSLRQVDANSLKLAFANIKLFPIFVSAGALVLQMLLRAVRWRVIAGEGATNFRHFFTATNFGVLTSFIIPGRVGELVRIITLARLSGSTLPGPLASAMIDRFVDVLMLIACIVVLYFFSPINLALEKWFLVLVVGTLFAVLMIALFATKFMACKPFFLKITRRWLQRWNLKPEVFFEELSAEFRRLLHSKYGLELIPLAVLIIGLDYVAIASVMVAFNLTISPFAPLLLWVFIAAGTALPSAPGYTGVYQIAAVFALSFFGVPSSTAVALATVIQITVFAVAILLSATASLRLFKRVFAEIKRTRLME